MPSSATSRRIVLKTLALAAPAIVGVKSKVRAEAAHEGKLGVALCGLGGFSKQTIAPELPVAKSVYLAGVITGDAAKGREWAAQHGFPEKNIFSYADMAKLADCKDIQIVHVVTPNALHATHGIAAAKAGKHVMCEKPMATSTEQCEALIDAARAAGVSLGVNYRLQWEPHHVKAGEAVRNGAVGDPTNGNYEFSWGYARSLSNPQSAATVKKWLLDPALAGGGAMFDTGVYPIQAACSLTGKTPVSVRGFPATRHTDLFPAGVEETMGFELMFDDGFQALCRASYGHGFHQCTTLGPKGAVEVLPGIPTGSVYGQSGGAKANAKRLLVNKQEMPAEDTLQLAVLLDEFARAITTKTPFKADGAMGRRDVRIIEAIYASAARGGVSVPVTV
jgi:glucose-fructose oxidoreductase